jgi:ABC-type multidrug transport system ATPase subunit
VLQSRGTPTDQNYIWYGLAVIVGEYFFLVFLTALALKYLRVEPTPPPPIIAPFIEEEYTEEEVPNDVIPPSEIFINNMSLQMIDADLTSQLSAKYGSSKTNPRSPHSLKSFRHKKIQEIPFEPISFSFKDVWYTVVTKEKEELDLLKGVSGYFEPGTLTALMGSSGAGKTTLLDVLSGRKNTGIVKGGMFVNGRPKEEHSFRKNMGYVEQFDSLSPMETARDAIEFSAALRLPRGTSTSERESWVNTVLIMLELTPLENTLIGTETTGGMSFEQKKRVSIGVELAANPAILFLDEPTTGMVNKQYRIIFVCALSYPILVLQTSYMSNCLVCIVGLDSRAAQVVIRNIKRVAASGRSIVCTIHQPSSVIFSAFDSLLLLQRGGRTVFFGQLGENCSELVRYFESAPHVVPIGPTVNPATWMLDAIGAGTSTTQTATDFSHFYNESELCAVNMSHTNVLCSASIAGSRDDLENQIDSANFNMPSFEKEMHSGKYNTTLREQMYWLFTRASRSYWRSPSYNITRFAINVVIALIFASAYSNQTYNTDVNVVSRSAVIYITVFFCGVVGMQNVLPVAFSDRPAFYREQQSEMYSIILYSLVYFLVEIPYVTLASLSFTLPFFFIVGFQHVGNVTAKFFWYWLFQGLFTFVMVYFGQLFAALCPSPQSAQGVSYIQCIYTLTH